MHIKQEILKWYIGNNNQLESIKFWFHITYSKCVQNIGQTKNSDTEISCIITMKFWKQVKGKSCYPQQWISAIFQFSLLFKIPQSAKIPHSEVISFCDMSVLFLWMVKIDCNSSKWSFLMRIWTYPCSSSSINAFLFCSLVVFCFKEFFRLAIRAERRTKDLHIFLGPYSSASLLDNAPNYIGM